MSNASVLNLQFILSFFCAIAPAAQSSPPANWGLAAIDSDGQFPFSVRNMSDEIIIAVIDTGVDLNHPDLREHLWTNPGETGFDGAGRDRANNGIDDDLNGFIDDIHGWNFADGSSDINDSHGHGTHIAGIASAVAPRVKLMILKYFDPNAGSAMGISSTVQAINYAVRMHASIINYSAGGPIASNLERDAIARAGRQGLVFVAAAGNEASNSDIRHYYPADYGLANILSVTAVSPAKRVLASSNFGIQTVQIAAPGEAIPSTMPNGTYALMTGTSQATAFVSGVAALLLASEPDMKSPQDVIEHLVESGQPFESLKGKTKESTMINARRALQIRGLNTDAFGGTASNVSNLDQRIFSPDDDVDSVLLHSRVIRSAPH